MPGSKDTSFIPKHTTNNTERRKTPRQLFIGTIFVRVLFFSVLIATVGVFFYERKLGAELAVEVNSFREATKSFEADEERLQTVLAMDKKLIQTSDRLNNSISILTLLKAIESSTISTTKLNRLEIVRKSDSELILNTDITTDSFDSVMFQRTILKETEALSSLNIKDVSIVDLPDLKEGESAKNQKNSNSKELSFKLEIEIDPSLVPALVTKDNVVNDSNVLIPVEDNTFPATTTTEVSEISNQENL